MTDAFSYKGYGRIVVFEEAHVSRVLDIIKALDEYEFEGYYPKDLICCAKEGDNVYLIYTHKFQMDSDRFHSACAHAGIVTAVYTQPDREELGQSVTVHMPPMVGDSRNGVTEVPDSSV